jgi:hypothetical protein
MSPSAVFKSVTRNQLWITPICRHFVVSPDKIDPSGEPIKTRLLGCFLTLRKDDGDEESHRPPPSPPPNPVGYVIVGDLFSAFSQPE